MRNLKPTKFAVLTYWHVNFDWLYIFEEAIWNKMYNTSEKKIFINDLYGLKM